MPTTWDSLAILLFFAIPGFLGDRLLRQISIRAPRDAVESVLGTVLWSLVNYLICLPLVWWLLTGDRTRAATIPEVLLWAVVLLAAPVTEALVLAQLLGSERVKRLYAALGFRVHPIPKSWDYAFSRGKPYFVLATLTDGTRIGGYWGVNSFASAFPAEEDLYLEQLWRLGPNSEFIESDPLSAGALIRRVDIRYLELYKVEGEEATQNGGKAPGRSQE